MPRPNDIIIDFISCTQLVQANPVIIDFVAVTIDTIVPANINFFGAAVEPVAEPSVMFYQIY